ncbi:MAG: hypothetical protein JOY64_03510 [Alphaproteobacteria bacterium]|nr:hypothetical protein [Alphaproteobacteria bacterium]
MNRRYLAALIAGALTLGIGGALIATAEPQGAVFIAGDRPVSEAQIREKMTSDGYSDIRIVRQAGFFEASGSKDGKAGKIVVNAQTGRLMDDDDDDDE